MATKTPAPTRSEEDDSGLFVSSDASRVETQVAAIIFHVTGQTLEGADSIELIGLDSLNSILMVAAIRDKFKVRIPPGTIKIHGATLSSFAAHLVSLMQPSTSAQTLAAAAARTEDQVAMTIGPFRKEHEAGKHGPAAAMANATAWKSDFLAEMQGLRGVLILWYVLI
jgi:acyl carrier protein